MSVDQSIKSMSPKEAVKIILAENKQNTPNNVLIRRVKERFNLEINPSTFTSYKSEIRHEHIEQNKKDQINSVAEQAAQQLIQTIKKEEPPKMEEKQPLTVDKIIELTTMIEDEYPGGWLEFEKNMSRLHPFIEFMKGFYTLRDATEYIRKIENLFK